MRRTVSRPLCAAVLAAFTVGLPGLGADGSDSFSLLKPSGNVREYYSSNRENRFLIRVQVWGDSPLPGIHYVPDNTTVMDLIGLTGGPGADYEDAKITVSHTTPAAAKGGQTEIRMTGSDLLRNPELRSTKLQNGDVVSLKMPSKEDTVLRTLGFISTVLGVITAGAAVYLIAKKN